MASVAELVALRDSLILARLSGVREVRDSSGEAVTYRSDAEIAAALAFVSAQIALLTNGPRASMVRVSCSKGL